MEDKEVIVVGAGPGGLTCAMLLAHRGFKVTVLERAGQVGGRNASLRLGDYLFDTGPTFLMMTYILDEMFRETGRRAEEYLDLVPLDPMYELVFRDKSLAFTPDPDKMAREIGRHFPGREEGLRRFRQRERTRFHRLSPCLQRAYSRWTDLMTPVLLRAIPHLDLTRSVLDNVLRYFGEEELGICFSFQSKYLGMSPWSCPAAFTILSYIEHAYGIYHVMGGLSEISEAMAKVVREEGGEIRLDTPVARVLTRGRKAVGVRLENGDELRAADIVLNADFGHAMSRLVPSRLLGRWHPDRLRDRPFSCSTFMLYLGVDRTYDMAHHSIVFADDYRRNLREIFEDYIPSEDMSLYVRNAGVTDPTLAPEGKSAIYVLVPAPNNRSDVDWDGERESYRARVLERIAERTPMHDLKEHIEVEKVITPWDWERDYNVYLGATFNLGHSLRQMMYFRPRNQFESLDHCYLVGGGTHPGSGLPTIYESGRISANLICGRYGVRFEAPRSLAEMEEGRFGMP